MADDIDLTKLDRGDNVTSPLDTAGKVPDAKPAEPASTTPDPAAKPTEEPDKLDEGVETAEEKLEREREEEEAKKRANIRIPKARFDEAQTKARQREEALRLEIERLKSGQQVTSVQKTVSDQRAKLNELQDKYEDLLVDGKKNEAREVRREADAIREQLLDLQTNVKSDATRTATLDELAYNAQLANIESTYAELNPEHERFDAAKTDEVAELLTAFVKTGMPRAAALAKAVKYVVGPPPEQKTSDAAKTLAEARAKQAREKAAQADKQQPTSTHGVGLDSDKAGKGGEGPVDVMRLTADKFAKLDEETVARLRGDFV